MAMSVWVDDIPAWVWAVESSPARSAKAGVASSAAAPAKNRIFFIGGFLYVEKEQANGAPGCFRTPQAYYSSVTCQRRQKAIVRLIGDVPNSPMSEAVQVLAQR